MLQNFSMAKQKQFRGPYNVTAEDLSKFGKGGIKVRQWRVFRGMTVAALADEAGVSEGTVSGIESGDSGWSWVTLTKLAKALETTAGALLDVNPLENPEFWAVWTRANAPQRQRITDYSIGVVGPLT